MNQIQATKTAFERPEWYLESRDYNIRLRAEVVRDFVGNRERNSILDIGCGSGAISVPLLTTQSQLTLVDLSARMLEIAQSKVPEALKQRVKTINTGFMSAVLEPHTYDLVICLGVVAYIEDLNAFALKLTSLLTPGGLLILECTNSSHVVSSMTAMYESCRRLFAPPKVPLILRSSTQIRTAIEKFGLRQTQSYQYTLPLPVWQKCFGHEFHYKTIRCMFGNPKQNRNSWLGNECIYAFAGND